MRNRFEGQVVMWFLQSTTLLMFVVAILYVYEGPNYLQFLPVQAPCPTPPINPSALINSDLVENDLKLVLEEAATPNKTVILTSLTEAWAAPGSVFDLFLESFRIGNNTQQLLRHLLVVSFDDKAHERCLDVHKHCYRLDTQQHRHMNLTKEAFYMSENYLEIVWSKIDFLHSVLSLGFNFVFTDCDIMWLQDPFPRLASDSNFQVACDVYRGNPTSMSNLPNTGFLYVRSDKHTILFYKIWYMSRYTYKGKNDQDGFNIIIRNSGKLLDIIGLKINFLDTAYFSGFCQIGKDFSKLCTMHANCCVSLARKTHDLRLVLDNWKNYSSSAPTMDKPSPTWSAPSRCTTKN